MLFTALLGISRRASHRISAAASRVPSHCAVCHAWPSQRVCDACAARFAQPTARCQRCALRVPEGVAVCGVCTLNPPLFDACVAAVDYAYPWADILGDFKFRGDAGWAGTLATLMRSTPWIEPALEGADRVIAVPLSAQRLREREFNQAALLARQLAGAKADPLSLLRIHATEAQSNLARAQRLRNLQGAFAVEPQRAAGLRGQRVVLVDDVMTTGATLHAATQALQEAGVAHVAAIVMARTGTD